MTDRQYITSVKNLFDQFVSERIKAACFCFLLVQDGKRRRLAIITQDHRIVRLIKVSADPLTTLAVRYMDSPNWDEFPLVRLDQICAIFPPKAMAQSLARLN